MKLMNSMFCYFYQQAPSNSLSLYLFRILRSTIDDLQNRTIFVCTVVILVISSIIIVLSLVTNNANQIFLCILQVVYYLISLMPI
jgi:hypothetical protein